jgi:hypothetical protein
VYFFFFFSYSLSLPPLSFCFSKRICFSFFFTFKFLGKEKVNFIELSPEDFFATFAKKWKFGFASNSIEDLCQKSLCQNP